MGVEVVVEGRDGEDSSCSLMVVLPPFVTRVRDAVSPASSNSSKSLRNFCSSAFILDPESESTTSHFDNFHSTRILFLQTCVEVAWLRHACDNYLRSHVPKQMFTFVPHVEKRCC